MHVNQLLLMAMYHCSLLMIFKHYSWDVLLLIGCVSYFVRVVLHGNAYHS
jgi:hypothetical protein